MAHRCMASADQQQPGGQSGQSGQQGSTRIERHLPPKSGARAADVGSTAVDTLTHPSTPVNMR